MDRRIRYRLVCSECGSVFDAAEHLLRWRCDCGGPFDLDFKPEIRSGFPRLIAKREMSWLRYREALPFEVSAAVRLGEGCTPTISFHSSDRGETEIVVKQEQVSVSGSFKDRGAFALVSVACLLGVQELMEDSSGNAGAAIAAYCGRAGIGCKILVPGNTGSGKTAQIEAYGAEVVRIEGSREDTAAAARRAAETIWYGSHVWNPFFFHGTKLFAYELWEGMGFTAPDTLVLPVGNGTLIIGAYIGFSELEEAGLIDKIPAIIGVQADRCAPLVDGVAGPSAGETVAAGIAIAAPARGKQIRRLVKASGGSLIAVSEAEIIGAGEEAGRAGFYVEPTGVVGLAGAKAALKRFPDGLGIVVTAFTGHGLKVHS